MMSMMAACVELFAGAGWPSHQHQSVSQFGDLGKLGGQVERFQSGNVRGNNAHHDRIDAALLKNVDAKAGT